MMMSKTPQSPRERLSILIGAAVFTLMVLYMVGALHLPR